VFGLGINQKLEEINLGENWCHLGHDKIHNNKIKLSWFDMPISEDKLNGEVVIEIIDITHMKAIENFGGFGKPEWAWVSQSKNILELVNTNLDFIECKIKKLHTTTLITNTSFCI